MAGTVMWLAASDFGVFWTLIISVGSAMIASWLMYMVGRAFGDKLIGWYARKFPKQYPYLIKQMNFLREKGCIGVFVGKLIPVARTLIGLPAGMLKVDFLKYTVASTLGIIIWNACFIMSGYYFSEFFLNKWL